ncbi:hypothetical protein BD413DRAFT_557239 [Trametes elegans]|nr:hypothetical protein BD413DRAFT_557239 [Trametes elegans]
MILEELTFCSKERHLYPLRLPRPSRQSEAPSCRVLFRTSTDPIDVDCRINAGPRFQLVSIQRAPAGYGRCVSP